MTTPKKIVVTGIGATSPLGGTAEETWQALLRGESGISTLEQDWVAKWEIPVTFAGQAKVPSSEVMQRIETKRLDPSSQFALTAAREAWADAGSPEGAPLRFAGTGRPASAACGRSSTPGTPSARRAPAGSSP